MLEILVTTQHARAYVREKFSINHTLIQSSYPCLLCGIHSNLVIAIIRFGKKCVCRKQEAVLTRTTCDVILSRSPRAP